MFKKILIVLILAMSANPIFAEENKFMPNGPFSVRNQMPLYTFYLAMEPDRAETLKKERFTAEAGYHVSNVIISEQDGGYWGFIDTEISRLYADIKYGVQDNLEIGINISYLNYSGGYLDSFIESFEDIFSSIDTPAVRDAREKNKYEFRLEHNEQKIIEDYSKPEGLSEITLKIKYKILEETEYCPTLSLRSALKLPSASADLLGSEKIDYGFGILADKQLSDRLFMYANFNLIFIQKPDILDELNMENYMLSGLLGLEFFLTNRTSMVFQAAANSSVYKEGVSSMEKDAAVLSFGFNHNFNDKISWQIAIDENTNSAAPDFGIFTSLKFKL